MENSLILYMSTYPPRECGIATFTKDLTTAMDEKLAPAVKSKIIAMNQFKTNFYNYDDDVIFEISENEVPEYIAVAEKINAMNSVKLVSIQHEFGIYGGLHSEALIKFLEVLNKSVVITFHTVLPNPDPELKKIVRSLAKHSSCISVMTAKGIDILREDYNLKTKIVMIPHGIPAVPFDTSFKKKMALGFKDKIVLSSFGLINSGKGYEYVLDALPEVIKKFPNLVFLIIGETHPVVRRKEGEHYRNFLQQKVEELGIPQNVKFLNKYLKIEEIIQYIRASDIYISSGLDPNQIVSGTLSLALGCGRAVISTPFTHAKDIITHERGLLVEFRNPKSYTKAIITVLSNPGMKERMERNSFSFTRHMTWPNVSLSYISLFNKITGEFESFEKSFPRIKLNHIKNLTDDFGILQFAIHTNPDKLSGYTLDDNARALLVCAIHYDIYKEDSILKLVKKYLNFIKFVQQYDGKLYNYVDYNRKVNLEHWTDDAQGRAMWALGYLVSSENIPGELKKEAGLIFEKVLRTVEIIKSPRAIAYITIGLYYYQKAKKISETKIKKLADYLLELYNNCHSVEWDWFENYLTYSNSKLPEALFCMYRLTGKGKYLKVAKATLDFLISITFENNIFAPIGQHGWYIKNGHRAYFDQQPVDTSSMVQTLLAAYDITKEETYLKYATIVFKWFLGMNSLNQVVYDETTGGCYDGIGEFSVNLNQGAESSLSYLLARLAFKKHEINT
ncbi:glycosyltransferase [bacterium]|nr:glycosyltransferase [bacterium]